MKISGNDFGDIADMLFNSDKKDVNSRKNIADILAYTHFLLFSALISKVNEEDETSVTVRKEIVILLYILLQYLNKIKNDKDFKYLTKKDTDRVGTTLKKMVQKYSDDI